MSLSSYGLLLIDAAGNFAADSALTHEGYELSFRKFSLMLSSSADRKLLCRVWPENGDGHISMADSVHISWHETKPSADKPHQHRPAYYYLVRQHERVLAAALCFTWSDSLVAWVRREAPCWLSHIPEDAEYFATEYYMDERTGQDKVAMMFLAPDGGFIKRVVPQRKLDVDNLPGVSGLRPEMYAAFITWLEDCLYATHEKEWLRTAQKNVPRYYNQGDAYFGENGVTAVETYAVGEDPAEVRMSLFVRNLFPKAEEEPRWISAMDKKLRRLCRFHPRQRSRVELNLRQAKRDRKYRELNKEKDRARTNSNDCIDVSL